MWQYVGDLHMWQYYYYYYTYNDRTFLFSFSFLHHLFPEDLQRHKHLSISSKLILYLYLFSNLSVYFMFRSSLNPCNQYLPAGSIRISITIHTCIGYRTYIAHSWIMICVKQFVHGVWCMFDCPRRWMHLCVYDLHAIFDMQTIYDLHAMDD